MLRFSLIILFFFILNIPQLLIADDSLLALDAVIAAKEQVQPGLQSYLTTVEISGLEEKMSRLINDASSDGKPLFFKNYQVNQPLPESILARLTSQ